MDELSSPERRRLRARAHSLQPVVMIGEAGLTPGVLSEIDASLRSHELIKVRVLAEDRKHREALIEKICDALAARPVQHIGKVLVVYRPRPEQEENRRSAPRAAKKEKRRRSKRSYQMQGE